MAGKIHRLIQQLLHLRSQGRTELTHFVRAHLMLSGIDPDQYEADSDDDPDVIARLEKMIGDYQGKR